MMTRSRQRTRWAPGLCWAALALGLATCSGPSAPGDCEDGIDNDADGFIDGEDFGCIFYNGALEADPAQCQDGVDNDRDGLVDLADFGCAAADDRDEEDPIGACNDGLDNDGDGWIDHPDDRGCASPVDDDEYNPPACADGQDNDGDGISDHPNDPGCASPDDDDETTPFPLPACADGQDNDLDGAADFPDDPGCAAAGDDDEYNLRVGECGPTVAVEDISATGWAAGSVTGPLANELSSPVCGGFGGEHAYVYQVAETTALILSTDHPETTLDTVVYLRAACRDPETELSCDDDGGVQVARASRVYAPYVVPGLYYAVVDAFSPGSLGAFKLSIEHATPLGGTCDPADPDACIPGLECREELPGTGSVCAYPVCSDGLDNDGDGAIDFPFDPGCMSLEDADESDPAVLPECADGLDNDSDGAVDFPDDDGCQSAADDAEESCVDSAAVVDISHQAVTVGATVGAGADQVGTCGTTFDAPDVVHRLRIPGRVNNLTMSTDGSDFDTVLYVRGADCAGVALDCDDDSGPGQTSTLLIGHLDAGVYHVVVDGWGASEGNYVLTLSGTIPVAERCDPAQVSAGVFACTGNSACVDDGVGATRCL